MLPKTFIVEFISSESGNSKRVLITEIQGDKNSFTKTQVMQIAELMNDADSLPENLDFKITITATPLVSEKILELHQQNLKTNVLSDCPLKFTKRQKQYCHYTFSKLMSPEEIAIKLELSLVRVYQISQECYVVIGGRNAPKLSEIFLLSYADWVDPDKYPKS